MKKLSLKLLAEIVAGRRKAKKISQTALAKMAGMNRSVLSRLEMGEYSPSVDQLLTLSSLLDFPVSDVIAEEETPAAETVGRKKMRLWITIQNL